MELSKDLQNKAQWVADLLAADGVSPKQIQAMPEEQKQNLIMAYMDEIGKKIEAIQNKCLTNPQAMAAMHNKVKSVL